MLVVSDVLRTVCDVLCSVLSYATALVNTKRPSRCGQKRGSRRSYTKSACFIKYLPTRSFFKNTTFVSVRCMTLPGAQAAPLRTLLLPAQRNVQNAPLCEHDLGGLWQSSLAAAMHSSMAASEKRGNRGSMTGYASFCAATHD